MLCCEMFESYHRDGKPQRENYFFSLWFPISVVKIHNTLEKNFLDSVHCLMYIQGIEIDEENGS